VIEAGEPEMTLMGLWARHKQDCRPISAIVADARSGNLPGVEPLESGFGHRVVNEQAALAAMQRNA
jgi:hypothetical protein